MPKILVGLLLAAFLTPTVASADHLQAQTERLVHWAGCHADVYTSDEHSVMESFYDGNALYVGTGDDTPYDVWLFVLLHETSHCLQYETFGEAWGEDYRTNTQYWELDADHRAAQLACGLGLDGSMLLHDAFAWAYKTYQYIGDENHGTLYERIHMGDGACPRDDFQAPLLLHKAL